jgi:hypothetical protein
LRSEYALFGFDFYRSSDFRGPDTRTAAELACPPFKKALTKSPFGVIVETIKLPDNFPAKLLGSDVRVQQRESMLYGITFEKTLNDNLYLSWYECEESYLSDRWQRFVVEKYCCEMSILMGVSCFKSNLRWGMDNQERLLVGARSSWYPKR